MHIGDSQEALARDVTARREAMVGQLRQLVERLNVAPGHAIPPAAVGVDTVRISPEARQAMNSLAGAGQPGGGASPAQVIAAIRAVLLASTPEASVAATARLAELVRNIVHTFPARTAATLRGYPIDDRAADLVRAMLLPSTRSAPEPATIAALVLSLFAGKAADGAPPEATLQRAALAIFLAATRTSAEEAPAARPSTEAALLPREFPPALLGHLAQPGPQRRVESVRRRHREDDSHHDDDPTDEDPHPDDEDADAHEASA